MQQQTRTL